MAISRKRLKHGISFFALVSLLTACGGGGGDEAAVPSAPTPTVAVTEANAAQLASLAMNLDISSVSSSTAVILAAEPAQASSPLIDMVRGHADMMNARMRGVSGRFQPLLTSTTTIACGLGGSMSVTANVASNVAPTVGDAFTISFSQCAELSGVMTGSLSLTFTTVSGDVLTATPAYAVGMALSYNAYRLSNGADYIQLDGDVRLSESDDGLTYTAGIRGKALAMTSMIGGVSGDLTLSQYEISDSQDYATGEWSNSINYTVQSAAIGGVISVATTLPFVTAPGDFYPYQGVMVITGADKAKVKVTALDAINVQIEGDFDGDGIYEYLMVTTWATL